jgi:hypothetical protein
MTKRMTDRTKQTERTQADNVFVLDLRQVRANSYQPRRNGVIPALHAAGYGLFEELKGHENKMPLWVMLTSNKPELWALAVGLIDEHEPEIKELADSIAASTQLHNVGIVPVEESDANKGYDVVYGMIRCLARAYNHGRSGGELPLTVKAEIAQDIMDPNDLRSLPLQEKRGQRSESLIDEAKQIQFLKRNGLTIPQIADKLGTNQHIIRNRLKLLRLTLEEQHRVHVGKLGIVNANKLVDHRDQGKAAEGETATNRPENHKRMPRLKEAQTNYAALEKPTDMPDEVWALWTNTDVRRFVAFYLGIKFTTFEDMVKAKNPVE